MIPSVEWSPNFPKSRIPLAATDQVYTQSLITSIAEDSIDNRINYSEGTVVSRRKPTHYCNAQQVLILAGKDD